MLTLFTTPVVYIAMDGLSRRFGRKRPALDIFLAGTSEVGVK